MSNAASGAAAGAAPGKSLTGRAAGELRARGVDPEHVALAAAGLLLWRFVRLLRRVGRLERDAAAVDARLRGLEHALRAAEGAAEEVVKAEKDVTAAAWHLGHALKLPW
jgi:hypothetical protein